VARDTGTHVLPPWHDRQDLVIIQDEAEALLFHQRISMVISKQLLYYTDASVRNGWAGVAVVKYQPHGTTTVPKVVRQETIGREKTCTVASAEIYAIRTALEFLRKDRATEWIVTDSQEALRRIDSGGRSRKSEAVVQAALREIQVIREKWQHRGYGPWWSPSDGSGSTTRFSSFSVKR